MGFSRQEYGSGLSFRVLIESNNDPRGKTIFFLLWKIYFRIDTVSVHFLVIFLDKGPEKKEPLFLPFLSTVVQFHS